MKRFSLILAPASGAMASHASLFQVTWTNDGPQPLSPMFWSVGDDSSTLSSSGERLPSESRRSPRSATPLEITEHLDPDH